MPLRRGVSVKGDKELRRNLRNLGRRVFRKKIAPAIEKEAARILGVAVQRTSVDTGELQRNVQVLKAKLRMRGGEPVDVESGFVFLQIYAAQHHEGLPANGGEVWPGGGRRKYAELAIRGNMNLYLAVLGKAVRDAIG